MIGKINYFRFLDAPNVTYRLMLNSENSLVFGTWACMNGGHIQKRITAFSTEQAISMALEAMDQHLYRVLCAERIQDAWES
jgi:hypothetical protein